MKPSDVFWSPTVVFGLLLTLTPVVASAEQVVAPAAAAVPLAAADPVVPTVAAVPLPPVDSVPVAAAVPLPAADPLLEPILRGAVQAAAAPALRIPDYRSPGCPGCPKRSWGKALIGTFSVNVAFNLINLAARPDDRDEFKISPATWWKNLKYGYIFDDNNFQVNQFGHPYQGGMYFNAGRARGLNYWESSMMSFLGSFSWECCGEKNRGSINDLYSTTMGGMVLGEVFHRMAGLVRDNMATSGRGTKELIATAIDPIGGLTRLVSGDWGEVKANPPDQRPDVVGMSAQVGAIWRGAAGTLDQAKAYPYLAADLLYGDLIKTPARKPFDAFTAQFVLGGGKGFSEFVVNGRLWGKPLKDTPNSATRLQLTQGFLFLSNPAYDVGGQSIGMGVAYSKSLGSQSSLYLYTSGQFMPLGAISAEYVNVNERTYDYGPTAGANGTLAIRHRQESVLRLFYTTTYLKAVNGSGGSHAIQMFQVASAWPLTRRLSAGALFSMFVRNSFYDVNPDTFTKYPESRVFLGIRF